MQRIAIELTRVAGYEFYERSAHSEPLVSR